MIIKLIDFRSIVIKNIKIKQLVQTSIKIANQNNDF